MAKAEKTTIIKRVIKTTEKPGITLTLSMPEASTLIAMAAKVGGNPDNSPRGWLNNIFAALQSAGAEGYADLEEYDVLSGGLEFHSYTTDSKKPVNTDDEVEQGGAV
jgi:hypothetical protein